MDKSDFMNIMQLTEADVRVVDPDVLGIALLMIQRTKSGELQLQIGANVPDDIVFESLFDLLIDHHKRKKARHG
jgi:hypothetical protein